MVDLGLKKDGVRSEEEILREKVDSNEKVRFVKRC